LPRSASELPPVLMNRILLREATCAIVRQEAEDISPMILFQHFDLASHHAARGVDLLDREIDRHHRVFAERAEKAGARRQVADPDDI
jgi:hypothetical protein